MRKTFKDRREENKRRRKLYVRGLPPNHVDDVVVEEVKDPLSSEEDTKADDKVGKKPAKSTKKKTSGK